MTVQEARGLLPRHQDCMCSYIPANVGEDTEDQKRSKSLIKRAIDSSLRAEAPSKRTLAEQRQRSRWAGADKTIHKRRPTELEPTGIVAQFDPDQPRDESGKWSSGGGGGKGPEGTPAFIKTGLDPTERKEIKSLSKERTELNKKIKQGTATPEDEERRKAVMQRLEELRTLAHSRTGKQPTPTPKPTTPQPSPAPSQPAPQPRTTSGLRTSDEVARDMHDLVQRDKARKASERKIRAELQSKVSDASAEHRALEHDLTNDLRNAWLKESQGMDFTQSMNLQSYKDYKAAKSSPELKPSAERLRAASKELDSFNHRAKQGAAKIQDEAQRIVAVPVDQQMRISPMYLGDTKPSGTVVAGIAKFEQITASAAFPENVGKVVYFNIDSGNEDRGRYSNGQVKLGAGRSRGQATIIHELGHHLEEKGGAYREALRFRTNRTRGAKPKSLGWGYGKDEVYLPRTDGGKWFDNYAARVYNFPATEIISVGMENLGTRPLEFYQKDPEMFKFVVGIARGEHRSK